MNETVKAIKESGMVVTTAIRKKYFDGQDFLSIRNWLEANGLNRHLTIELRSTEVAIITPFGIMMQIRPTDKEQLGLWGGVLKDNETPEEGALRELKEETGLVYSKADLVFVEENNHTHEYANGDKASFHCYRFKIVIDHVPSITTDEESVGAFMVVHTILAHQQEYIKKLLGEL